MCFLGAGQKCPDARRQQTREEAYLNGTLTKRVCWQRRRWAFFTSPLRLELRGGMAQISYNTIGGLAVQRLIQRQGVSSRSRAVQNKFVKKWAAWILMGTVVALFYVWSRVKVVEFGYELTAMQRNAGELAKQVSTLEAEVAG